MTATVMRPSSFRHDKRGSQVVEIRREEYERSKQAILQKIRRRLVILGVLVGLLSAASLVLGIIVRGYFMERKVFTRRDAAGLRLCDLYWVFSAEAAVFCLHGFYMDGGWRRLLDDGYRLILHVRVYSALGLGSCALALWLAVSTLTAFGLVEVQYITASGPNLVYLATLVLVCTHLVVSPWLLRTIHRKGSQADEYFGAEFVHNINRERRRERYRNAVGAARDAEIDAQAEAEAPAESEDGGGGDDLDLDAHDEYVLAARSAPPRSPRSPRQRLHPDELRRSPSGRGRTAFYDANGNALVGPSAARRPVRDVSLAVDATEYYHEPPRPRAADAAASAYARPSTDHGPPSAIPYASPVFVLDPHARLEAHEFWQHWKLTETAGAFSCVFTNHPTRAEVEAHLQANGFRVLSAEQRDHVLQVHLYASRLGGADAPFLCEFVLLFARRFFQATFKCKERDVASEFVTRFNLQQLLTVEAE